ncbi:MAG: RluA family pseudouridine synthase [Planctomycetes bacterium]|nr:RluA family pseudouridine synthase [Planctomycetota bacterium]
MPPWGDGQPLLEYLCRRFPYLDRDGWLQAIAERRLTIRGAIAHAGQPLRRGDPVTYRRAHREPPVVTEVPILHQDADLVVAAKPAHLPMHADGAFIRNTLVHLLQQRLDPALRLVHRLDRETSGVIVAARTRTAADHLLAQFAAGTVGKQYLAVVRGVVADPVLTVDGPIGRASGSAISLRRAVVAATAADATPARTTFAVLHRGEHHTVLRCTPATGRTHQIRVHLEHVGHPLLGDLLYGQPDHAWLEFVHRVKAGGDPQAPRPDGTTRQLLHASSLTFVHPGATSATTWHSRPPADWLQWWPDAQNDAAAVASTP